jgi:cytidylate kinase
VFLDGVDVTDKISQEVVGTYASRVSQLHKVRQALLQPQRDCALRAKNSTKGLVAEGRDCGTVVFPNAALKIYLTANQEHRAERRAKELGLSAEETVTAQKERDLQDSTRKAAPLAIPENSFVVDATYLDLKGVVDLIEEEVRKTI